MTFKQPQSSVQLVNLALGMISESKTVSTMEDPGHVAEVARRWYKPVVARLLEMHHWGIATKRVTPATVTNNRKNEWTYAYGAPDDMAFPVGFTLGSGVSSTTYFRGLSGLIGMAYGKPIFAFQGGVIYSHIQGELEFVSFEITEADFTATFADIVVVQLASKFALEIPKDYELSKAFADEATMKINMAIAQNLNAGNPRYGDNVGERELVRGSSLHNWDYIPLGPGA